MKDLFSNIKGVISVKPREYDYIVDAIKLDPNYIQIVYDGNTYNVFYKGVFASGVYSEEELQKDDIIKMCFEDIKETIFRCNLVIKKYENKLSDEELLDSLDW